MKSRVVLLIITIIAITIMGILCIQLNSRPQWRRYSEIGYAPFKFSAHKGWVPDKRFSEIVLLKKISPNLPKNNCSLLIQKLEDLKIPKNITIGEYVEKYWIPSVEKEQKVSFDEISDYTVDGISARSIIFSYFLTSKGITREIKSRVVKFVIGDYVYTFSLGSFKGKGVTS